MAKNTENTEKTVTLPSLDSETPFGVNDLNTIFALLAPFMKDSGGDPDVVAENVRDYLARAKEDSAGLDEKVSELVDKALESKGKDGHKMANLLPWVASSMGTSIDDMAATQEYVRAYVERNSSESHALKARYFRVVKGRNAGVWLWSYKPEEKEL